MGDWLRSSRARYCTAFAEHGVNGRTASKLTDEVLKELGVASAAHRLRLISEIEH